LETELKNLNLNRITACNTGLAKVAVQCSADTFVVNQTLVLRINIITESRHLRQARNRQAVKKLKSTFDSFGYLSDKKSYGRFESSVD
jgi:hypothetical protein